MMYCRACRTVRLGCWTWGRRTVSRDMSLALYKNVLIFHESNGDDMIQMEANLHDEEFCVLDEGFDLWLLLRHLDLLDHFLFRLYLFLGFGLCCLSLDLRT